uniref:Uncharacterized protein n=1 Tax=Coturnix japonica TaxID=93934 RepID=A0A8C2SR27_COTJA
MAAPMELFCWAGGWGLPSVDPDCLAVLTYARFTGAPLKVHRVCNPWKTPLSPIEPHGALLSPITSVPCSSQPCTALTRWRLWRLGYGTYRGWIWDGWSTYRGWIGHSIGHLYGMDKGWIGHL